MAVIERIKDFLKDIEEKRFLAQGLALQEEREKVKRLEKELEQANLRNGQLLDEIVHFKSLFELLKDE